MLLVFVREQRQANASLSLTLIIYHLINKTLAYCPPRTRGSNASRIYATANFTFSAIPYFTYTFTERKPKRHRSVRHNKLWGVSWGISPLLSGMWGARCLPFVVVFFLCFGLVILSTRFLHSPWSSLTARIVPSLLLRARPATVLRVLPKMCAMPHARPPCFTLPPWAVGTVSIRTE